jgi:hypothetical protein
MKKIGIITINDYNNYGNRLQNYASQEVLKTLGFHVETIVTSNNSYSEKKISIIKKIQNIREKSAKQIYMKVIARIKKILNENQTVKCRNKRIEFFKEFTRINILESNYTILNNAIPANLVSTFDYFIVGSDQVWNPFIRHGSSIDFLSFAPKSKRIAYSPSFGISEIPSEYIDRYKIGISEMNRLSVREKMGAEIIKELTGRDASVLIDPTLMLTKEKWISISKEAQSKPKDKYLLTYFIGAISKQSNRKIREIAMEKKLEIVYLNNIKDYERHILDPSEVIDLINSASVLCTDSFHGAIFSILMETPMVVFDRMSIMPSMNSRIETLLKTFKLESRMLKNIETNEQAFHINYEHVAPILEVERKKAIDYLKESLNVKN